MSTSSSSAVAALSTPISRRGPSSRLLQRQSLLFPTVATPGSGSVSGSRLAPNDNLSDKDFPEITGLKPLRSEVTLGRRSFGSTTLCHTVLGSPEVTRPLYSYRSAASSRLDPDGVGLGRGVGIDVDAKILLATDNLFVDFLATLSGSSSTDGDVFIERTLDQVADFEQLVGEHVSSLQSTIQTKSAPGQSQATVAVQMKTNLVMERNSWRLIGKLFTDRMTPTAESMESIASLKSEKRIAENLFQKERDLRQAQAIIDWLEKNARDMVEDEFSQAGFFGDLLVGWENTLHALRMDKNEAGNMMHVTELDPDAKSRQKRPLHDLDEQDQNRLIKAIYLCIRSGMLDSAQDLCVRLGQPWRAATLVGWKLCHDPNYEMKDTNEKLPLEGNATRDVWKRSAWILTEDAALAPQEKAIYSALCGNSSQLLGSVCLSWEDYLWALVRSMVDVKVELEIRGTMTKSFSELPQKYWENLTDLRSILDSFQSADCSKVIEEVHTPHRILQRHVILEEWHLLNKQLLEWTSRQQDSCNEEDTFAKDPHFLRFLTHFVLILKRLNVPMTTESVESVIVAYIRYLVIAQRPQQVAWYTSQLSLELQVTVYSDFLKSISNDKDRRMCLALAEENGLPLYTIRLRTVQDILSMEDSADNIAISDHHLSPQDDFKISAINFLLFEPIEREDCLIQTNALVRYFIASQKLEAAKIALVNIAPFIDMTVTDRESAEDHMKEYLCLQSYISAKESFSDWFEYLHKGKPIEPTLNEDQGSFTSAIALEQKEKQYKQDVDRWHGSLLVQSRDVCGLLLSILKFPNGWLISNINQEKEDRDSRFVEMDYIRRTCIMEVSFLLHSVYHSTRQYKEALQLADLLASEHGSLYQVFNKEDMRKFLMKLKDSSVALMEAKSTKDPLGY